MNENITAFILAGGLGKRLNTDKALLKLGDRHLIEIIYEKLQRIFPRIFISANNPELYRFLKIDIIPDIKKGIGPLGGLHACLNSSQTEMNFFIGCDMPLINRHFISSFIATEFESKILLPKADNYIQYLCGLYRKSCLSIIEDILNADEASEGKTGNYSMRNLIAKCGYRLFDVEEHSLFRSEIFMNINTHEDYEKMKRLICEDESLIK